MGKDVMENIKHFDIHLYMAYPSIAPPRERDLVLMEIFASLDLGRETVRRLNRVGYNNRGRQVPGGLRI